MATILYGYVLRVMWHLTLVMKNGIYYCNIESSVNLHNVSILRGHFNLTHVTKLLLACIS